MRVLSSSVVACVLLVAVPAVARPPDAQTILKRMKAALEPERPSIRTHRLAMRAADGSTTEWTARQARKRLPDGNRSLP